MTRIEADIAVVGLGPAGLAAAIAAAEKGASVVGFEKAMTPGGAANMGGGPFAVESKLQTQCLVDLTKEQVFEEFMDYTHWQCNARLVRDYFWKSGDTISWLMDMGVDFEPPGKFYAGSWQTWHKVKPEGGGPSGPRAASTMIKRMYERAEELGIQMYLQCPAQRILMENGEVTGLVARREDGEEIECLCDSVIIATGGFGDSPEMIREKCGFEFGVDMFNFAIPGLKGDGIRMAWECGGAHGDIDMETNTKVRVPDECFGLANIFNQPNLIVNIAGERVMNEAYSENPAILANVVRRQYKHFAYAICSSELVEYYYQHGLDWAGIAGSVFGNTMNFLKDHLELAKTAAPEGSYIVDAEPEELAAFFGIDPEGLKTTLAEYNAACEKGYDEYFNKPHRFLRPLRGKLWGCVIALSAYGSLGGIKINYKTQVITEAHKPIPGLYAAGTDTCDIYAGTYLYKLPGNTMGYAVNTGRIAGENAADYIFSLS